VSRLENPRTKQQIKDQEMSTTVLPENEDSAQSNQDSAGEIALNKNKGGWPKGKDIYGNRRLNIYLSDEMYALFMAYVSSHRWDHNISGVGRQVLESALLEWDKKGRKPR
jgi:hypothetical protein